MKRLFRREPKPAPETRALPRHRWLSAFHPRAMLTTFRQIRIQKAEHVGALDCTNAFLFLETFDGLVKLFHLRPMHFGPEMVLGMVSIVEKQPVVDFSVAAHPPGDRFIGICTIMPIIAVEITEAVAKVPERHEIKNHVAPVKQEHHEERCRERRKLEVAPEKIAIVALAQFFSNCADVVAKETQEHIAPWIFRFAVVPVTIN